MQDVFLKLRFLMDLRTSSCIVVVVLLLVSFFFFPSIVSDLKASKSPKLETKCVQTTAKLNSAHLHF